MPGLPYELGVIFAVEFRRQIRSKGFMFFTVLIVVLLVGAIPITPIVVSLVDSATGGDESEVDTRESPSPRYGYVDPAGILPDDIVLEGRAQAVRRQGRGHPCRQDRRDRHAIRAAGRLHSIRQDRGLLDHP